MKLAPTAAVFVASVALAAVVACLPDLAPLPDRGDAAEPAPFETCGDDLISPSAGETCDPGDADVPGCVKCQVTCEGHLDERSGHCYFVAGEDDSYSGARNRCRDTNNAHVVTIGSPEEDALVVDAGGGAAFWIGLTKSESIGGYASAVETEPGWPIPPTTGPCPGCFAIGADDAGAFADLADASSPACIAHANGTWHRTSCAAVDAGTTFKTICEREPPGLRLESCGGLPCFTVPFTTATKTYLIVESPEPEDVARSFCKSLEAQLVTFDTRQEREQVARELEKLLRDPRRTPSPLTFWIGLHRGEGGWRWDDDREDRPAPWGDRQPAAGNGRRAYLHLRPDFYDSQLVYTDDDGGATRRPYICELRRSPR